MRINKSILNYLKPCLFSKWGLRFTDYFVLSTVVAVLWMFLYYYLFWA